MFGRCFSASNNEGQIALKVRKKWRNRGLNDSESEFESDTQALNQSPKLELARFIFFSSNVAASSFPDHHK